MSINFNASYLNNISAIIKNNNAFDDKDLTQKEKEVLKNFGITDDADFKSIREHLAKIGAEGEAERALVFSSVEEILDSLKALTGENKALLRKTIMDVINQLDDKSSATDLFNTLNLKLNELKNADSNKTQEVVTTTPNEVNAPQNSSVQKVQQLVNDFVRCKITPDEFLTNIKIIAGISNLITENSKGITKVSFAYENKQYVIYYNSTSVETQPTEQSGESTDNIIDNEPQTEQPKRKEKPQITISTEPSPNAEVKESDDSITYTDPDGTVHVKWKNHGIYKQILDSDEFYKNSMINALDNLIKKLESGERVDFDDILYKTGMIGLMTGYQIDYSFKKFESGKYGNQILYTEVLSFELNGKQYNLVNEPWLDKMTPDIQTFNNTTSINTTGATEQEITRRKTVHDDAQKYCSDYYNHANLNSIFGYSSGKNILTSSSEYQKLINETLAVDGTLFNQLYEAAKVKYGDAFINMAYFMKESGISPQLGEQYSSLLSTDFEATFHNYFATAWEYAIKSCAADTVSQINVQEFVDMFLINLTGNADREFNSINNGSIKNMNKDELDKLIKFYKDNGLKVTDENTLKRLDELDKTYGSKHDVSGLRYYECPDGSYIVDFSEINYTSLEYLTNLGYKPEELFWQNDLDSYNIYGDSGLGYLPANPLKGTNCLSSTDFMPEDKIDTFRKGIFNGTDSLIHKYTYSDAGKEFIDKFFVKHYTSVSTTDDNAYLFSLNWDAIKEFLGDRFSIWQNKIVSPETLFDIIKAETVYKKYLSNPEEYITSIERRFPEGDTYPRNYIQQCVKDYLAGKNLNIAFGVPTSH